MYIKDEKGHSRPRLLLAEGAGMSESPVSEGSACAVDEKIILSSPAGRKPRIRIRGIMPQGN